MGSARNLYVIQMADRPCVRMRKVISTFRRAGFKVVYVGCERGKRGVADDRYEIVHVPPSIPSRSLLKLLLAPMWVLAASLYVRFRSAGSFLYAADLEAGIAALLSGRRYVYDVLDTYADRYRAPRLVKELLRWVEGKVALNAEVLIHVDEIRRQSIANRDDAIIVQNVPLREDIPAEVASTKFDIIASGNLDENRGVDQLLRAASTCNARVVLCGYLAPSLTHRVRQSTGVDYYGYVDSADALKLTRTSKAVYAVYDPSRSINIMACPNKFYDAVTCGIPVVVNSEIALARVVERERIGWTFEFGNVEQLLGIVRIIAENGDEYEEVRSRAKRYGDRIKRWDDQFESVVRTVETVTSRC